MKTQYKLSKDLGQRPETKREKGNSLIIVICIMGFLLVIGLVLLSVTHLGFRLTGNMRTYQQAFNAAEAGFDHAWQVIGKFLADKEWTSFEGNTVNVPEGIDLPSDSSYFRRLTDQELLEQIDAEGNGVIFFKEPYIIKQDGSLDSRSKYTVFLIDDEAGVSTSDPGDALLVCIGTVGSGSTVITSRIEIELAIGVSESDY
jgi:hypothetical protein